MLDGTVSKDDQLVERWKQCLFCGKPADWMNERAVGHLILCVCLCARCHTNRGWTAVDRLLQERYGNGQGS